MVHRRHYPLPIWTGSRWVASPTITGKDSENIPGPVGQMSMPGRRARLNGRLVANEEQRPK